MKTNVVLIVVFLVLAVVALISLSPAPFTGVASHVAEVRGAVVHVGKVGVCQGSGCIISPDGIILTAKHVSDGTYGEYVITLDDGRKFPVKYVVEDTENDIAFMQLDLLGAEPNLPYVTLAQEDTLRVGDLVFLMGSPLGRENFNSVSFGLLAAEARNLYDRPGWEPYQRYDWHVMMQTTSPAYPGNSGGPLFNMQGEAVGILVAGYDATFNFAVPVSRFNQTIDSVRDLFRQARFSVMPTEAVEPTGVVEMELNQGGFWYHSRMGR